MKIFKLSVVLGILFLSYNAVAQIPSPQQLRQMIKDEFNSPENQKMLLESFNAADVNNDGFISENEFAMMVNAINAEPLSDADKAAKKARWQQGFKTEDKNSDHKLDKSEYAYFMYHEVEHETLSLFEKVKVMATKSPEEMTQELNQKLEKARVEVEKLQAMSSDEIADKFLAAASDNLASENYFQMDKNKDGCVTADEYADYMVVYAQNNNDSYDYKISKADWKELYKTEEEKLKENCLTKDEYIRNFNKLLVNSNSNKIDLRS